MSGASPPRKKEIINKVEKWLREEFYAVKKIPDLKADVNFEVSFGPDDNRHVNFAFPRASNDSIGVLGGVQFTEDKLARIRQLTPQEKSDFVWRLRFGLASRNIAHKFEPSMADFERVTIWRNIFFDGLTKNLVISMGGEIYLAISTVLWETDKVTGSSPMASAHTRP